MTEDQQFLADMHIQPCEIGLAPRLFYERGRITMPVAHFNELCRETEKLRYRLIVCEDSQHSWRRLALGLAIATAFITGALIRMFCGD